MYVNINVLNGQKITKIERNADDTELFFYLENGNILKMYHEQDCCESVWLEDICGDLGDLLNCRIISASERSEENTQACESGTWTFYHIDSEKGSVVLRWNGESNGYYSESVNLAWVRGPSNIELYQHLKAGFSEYIVNNIGISDIETFNDVIRDYVYELE